VYRRSGVVRDLEHARVHLLQGINTLLEFDVVRRELGLPWGVSELRSTAAAGELAGTREDVLHVLWESHLIFNLANLFLDILLGPSSPRGERSTVKALSAYLELRMARPLCLGRADVRNALSESRNLSKVIHDDVCKVKSLWLCVCLNVGLASCLSCLGNLVDPCANLPPHWMAAAPSFALASSGIGWTLPPLPVWLHNLVESRLSHDIIVTQ
jgi:hypothetical protein